MEALSKGYMGNILRVNVTTGKVTVEPLSDAVVMQYIGGRGVAAKLLYDELEAGAEPLSPVNKLIFSTGPRQVRLPRRAAAGWSPPSRRSPAAYSAQQPGADLALK